MMNKENDIIFPSQYQYISIVIAPLVIISAIFVVVCVNLYLRKVAQKQTEYRKFDNPATTNEDKERKCWKILKLEDIFQLNYQRFYV